MMIVRIVPTSMYGIECKNCVVKEPIINAKSVLEQINGILIKVFVAPDPTMHV
jgi:hypothetical protein